MEVTSHDETISALKKSTACYLQHGSLSARVRTHPLAQQAQACGRLTQADGPEGPIALVGTIGSTHK